MSVYTIPALSFANEFVDLARLGQYVDRLVASTGDPDYAVVHEWEDDDQDRWPPVAVLVRRDGRWFRRLVLLSASRPYKQYRRSRLDLGPEEPVNGH